MNRHKKLMGAAAIGGALVLAMSGCSTANNGGGGGNEGEGPTTVTGADYNPQPRENLQKGGELRIPVSNIAEQLNHFHSDGDARVTQIATWYTPQILLMEPDGTVYKNDAYLDEYEIGEEGGNTVIRFKVNEKAVWNDGTPIDWKSFETTWVAQRDNSEYQPNATDGWKEIKSVEKGETDRDVIVTFDGKFAWPEMVYTGGLLHPAVNSAELFNTAFLGDWHPEWGAGPYTIENFDKAGGVVTLVPNEKWWGNEPLLDKVTFIQMEPNAAVNALRNDEVDMAETGTADHLAQVADLEGVKTYRGQATANALLELDSEKPALAELEVREAIFSAISIEQLKEITWDGLNYTEEPAGSLTLFSFQPGYSNSLEKAGRKDGDVEHAKELLDEAGWVPGEDGIREKDGVRLSIVFPIHSDTETARARGLAVQSQLKEIGVEVDVQIRPSADFADDYTSKNWDIFLLNFTSSDPFGAAWFCQLYCSDSSLNLSGTGTPEIDKKIHEEIETITDPEEQTKAAMELEAEIYAQTWGVMPLFNGPEIWTVKEGLANLTPEPYVGLDLFGVQPVENVGYEKE
ncbi:MULTISPECIES: ABC transporter family substrate-binding protein [Microbacterium]|uniref:ABC transporter family substrate-binding protein n=1 Tax=Microbacterium TaxID=33882 RepID=UPI00217D08A5|nr:MULTISPECIES: ABC transporter family substrate-binding protein [Microbacterium]UWF76668.1 ABC transporter family substrate-binding protein [Microbacterium neungamense]WCM54818.1 ABC transporter family substrate-binding protein [Microbacterium sp. EF45047]